MNARILPAQCVLLALAMLGCGTGQPVGQVAGRVTVGGQPLTVATIVFENLQSSASVSANLADDGTYTIRTAEQNGLPPGDYGVAIRPGRIGTGEAPLVGGPEETSTGTTTRIAAKYHDCKTSQLTAKVAAGANGPFDFELAAP